MTSDISQHGESNSDVDKQGPSLGRREFTQGVAGSLAVSLLASNGVAADGEEWYDQSLTAQGIGSFMAGEIEDFLGIPDEEQELKELHQSLYSDATEMEERRGPALNSVEDNIEMVRGYVRNNVAFTLVERAEAGDSDEDIKDAVEEEVGETLADIEQKLFNIWSVDFMALSRRVESVYNVDSTNDEIFYYSIYDGHGIETVPMHDEDLNTTLNNLDDLVGKFTNDEVGSGSKWVLKRPTIELLNGDSITLSVLGKASTNRTCLIPWAILPSDPSPRSGYEGGDSSELRHMYPIVANRDEYESIDEPAVIEDGPIVVRISIYPEDPAEDGAQAKTFLDAQVFSRTHNQIVDIYEDEVSNARSLVDTLADLVRDGEVNAHEVASGSAILDAGEELENWQQATAFYDAIDVPKGESPGNYTLANGVEVEGALYWTTPDGENGLPVGEEIDPDDRLGEIHTAAEVTHVPDDVDIAEGEVVLWQLTDPFEIDSISSGEDALLFEERELADPEDTEEIIEELERAYEIERRVIEGDTTIIHEDGGDGGGSGGGDDGLSDSVVLGLGALAAAALAAIGLAGDS